MKLYAHPASTTSRPIMLFLAEHGIDVELQVIDLFTGEHLQEEYAAVNPNRLVPALRDGDFTLTESSAILKYLADKYETADYPRDLKARARVNEAMDWFNANFYKDFGYNLVYPQLFPHHKRPTDAGQEATLAWGQARTRHWLKILDAKLQSSGKPYLCGGDVTIADYFGACLLELGKVIGCSLAAYPSVEAWMARMRALPSWNPVHEVVYGFAASLEGQTFKAI